MNSGHLQVLPRVPHSKANQLRRRGYVPGVLYGPNRSTTPVIFEKKLVENFIHSKGEGAVFEISVGGTKEPVRIWEVQRDPVTRDIIHLDLMQVALDQKIQVKVPLRFEGRQAMERRGITLQHQKDTVEVEGLVKDIPAFIPVPLHHLQGNSNIRIRDLEIADELSIMDAPNELIASALKPALKLEPETENSVKIGISEKERKSEENTSETQATADERA